MATKKTTKKVATKKQTPSYSSTNDLVDRIEKEVQMNCALKEERDRYRNFYASATNELDILHQEHETLRGERAHQERLITTLRDEIRILGDKWSAVEKIYQDCIEIKVRYGVLEAKYTMALGELDNLRNVPLAQS